MVGFGEKDIIGENGSGVDWIGGEKMQRTVVLLSIQAVSGPFLYHHNSIFHPVS